VQARLGIVVTTNGKDLTPRQVRFGPFEVDFETGELRKHGLRLKLQDKPLRVLQALIEKPGKLVTREELRGRLWPQDHYVDFDRNLTIAMNRLRSVLNDSAEKPRYIETLPRRGYRFIFSADGDGRPGIGAGPDDGTLPQNAVRDSPANTAPPVQEYVPASRRLRPRVWAAGTLVLAIAVGFVAWFRAKRETSFRIVPVTSSPGEKGQPAFSPDGSELAYRWRGEKNRTAQIYVGLIGAGTPLQLTAGASNACSPTWSPDGRYIAFVRDDGYYLIPALGGSERKISDTYGEACIGFPYGRQLDWSPDGKFLIAGDGLNPSDNRPSLVLISVDTGQRRALVSEPAGFVNCPVFSPNASKIAYAAGASYQGQEIYVVPTAGGKPRQLTSDGVEIWGISWSADGSQILFSSVRGGVPGLWVISPYGGTPEPANAPGSDTYEPTVARKGRRLAYLHHKINLNIWRAPGPYSATPAAAPTPLIVTSGYNSDISFSRDGRRIAYQSDRDGEMKIWTSNSDGTNPLPLTTTGVGRGGTPRWSPDGRSIAFDGEFQVENHSDIFVVSAQGGSPRRLTKEPFENVVPSWSRDGRWVYFSSDRTGRFEVWKVPSSGGSAVQVTKDGGFYPSESPDGKDLYYSKPTARNPDDSTLWKMPEGGPEIRVLDIGGGKVIRGGVCFVDFGDSSYEVKFLDFATNRVSVVSKLDVGILNPPLPAFSAFDVSPDGKWILYGYRQLAESDIMLVEGFH
jgi:Tol biopolymer transport system component/DNA-binding winged helix-turn-helix (wHTH) protein